LRDGHAPRRLGPGRGERRGRNGCRAHRRLSSGLGRRNRRGSRRSRVLDERGHRGRNGRRAHRCWSIGIGRRNRCGSRRSRILDRRLGSEPVVEKDARGKRREERYGHDERRFHGHGETVVDPAERVLTMCELVAWSELPALQLFHALRDLARERTPCSPRALVKAGALVRAASHIPSEPRKATSTAALPRAHEFLEGGLGCRKGAERLRGDGRRARRSRRRAFPPR
jgi:hypothetical protein